MTLSKDLARALREGHPWIFRDALERGPRLPDGTLVRVQDRGGRALAVGFWDGRSAIAVRVLGRGPVQDPQGEARRRLREALRIRRERLDPRQTNAFRWVHGEADGLPGMHIDLYGDVAVVRFDGNGARAFYQPLGPWLAEAAGPEGLRAVLDRETGARIHGRGAPAKFRVLENGLKFEVVPAVAGKGGLFLDQRENREEVERRASGKTVLNLFGYTGAFSLYALRGGARSADTVDSSAPAIAAARRNFDLNGMPAVKAGFHARDAFEFLEQAGSRRQTWSLVISDPPSFAPSERSRRSARGAYVRLHRLAARATSRGGLLCAASCSSHIGREEFLASVEEGASRAGRRFSLISISGAGFDHPVVPAFPEGDYLKFAVGVVE